MTSMKIRLNSSLFGVYLCVLLSSLLCGIAAHAASLQTTFGSQGLATLRYGDLTLADTNAHQGDAFSLYDVDGAPVARAWDETSQTLTWTYHWGQVACKYTQRGDQLDMDIAVDNRGSTTIEGFNMFPLALRFQGFPKGFDADTPHVGFNSDGPTVQSADFGSGIVSVINRDVTKTLCVGLITNNTTAQSARYDVYVGSAHLWYQPGNWPTFNRPIAPGGHDLYQISLRFSPSGTDTRSIGDDIYQKFAQAHPSELNWADRRPIASLFLSSASDNHPATNPRGWFYNDESVDCHSAEGRARLRERVMSFADDSIAEIKSVGAQGMVTWDIEGQEYPHSTSYIGDPRLLPQLAPEMDAIADEYFARFRAAGLRIGVCVRPQKFVMDSSSHAEQVTVDDTAQQLIDRIQYAKTRWGATLFYVDSNGGPYDPTDAAIFQQVARAHPDVLLIPEHQNAAYYAFTAPFNQLDEGQPFTPDEVRRIYPNAFSVVKLNGDNMQQQRAAIVEAARHGDILMFNGWFNSEDGQLVRDATAEATNGLRVTTTRDVVDPNDGQNSLREAMITANQSAGNCQITFADNVRGMIALNGDSLPDLTEDCEIVGPGAAFLTINANNQSGIFRIGKSANVTLSGLTLRGGNAGESVGYNGGAICNEGDLMLRSSVLRNNRGNAGGAIFNLGRNVSIERCTFNGNVGSHVGGAIFSANGALALWQCTLSGNSTADATGGGGAICANTVDLSLESCTLGSNRGPRNRGGVWFQGGVLTLHNSILCGNGARDVDMYGGSLTTNGYNLVGAASPTWNWVWTRTDKRGAVAALDQLRDNGAQTPTCALLRNSAALNAGDPSLNDATDQRGAARVSNGRADIGAFEVQAPPSASSSLQTSASGSGGSS